MRTFILSLLFVCHSYFSFAQSGNFYLKNYQNPLATTDQINRAVLAAKDGVMYFANTRGIITYNGAVWDLIQTQSTPHIITEAPNGTIFVACRQHFGYLRKDELGIVHYEIIASTYPEEALMQSIIIQKDYTYFFSERALYQVALKDYQITQVWKASISQPFTACFELQNQLYVQQVDKGLLKLTDGGLTVFQTETVLDETVMLFCAPLNEKNILLGLDDNSLWIFDGKNFDAYELEQEDYLESHLMTTGLVFSEKYLVIGTLTGGCMVIDRATKGTQQVIHYQTGLLDDEILALSSDAHGGLWICHEKGISRADLSLPMTVFSDYPGLKGTPTSILKTDSVLFVATNEGLFYLSKVKRIEQLVQLIKEEKKEVKVVERNIQTTIQVQQQPATDGPSQQENEEEYKNYSEAKKRRQARKAQRQAKREAKKASKSPSVNTPTEGFTPNKIDTLKVAKTIKEEPVKVQTSTRILSNPITTYQKLQEINLRSIPYLYSPVAGIDVKCRQVVPFNDRILVATSKGLYEVANLEKAQLIYPEVYVNYLYVSKYQSNLVFLGTQTGLVALRHEDDQWKVLFEDNQFSEAIYSIDEANQALWLGGTHYIHYLQLDKSSTQPQNLKTYALPNTYAETPIVRLIQGNPVFIISTGFYNLDGAQKKIIEAPQLQENFNPKIKILSNQSGFTWFRPKQQDWRVLEDTHERLSSTLPFLGFFEQIEDIYVDTQQNFWVIADGKIHKINADAYLEKQKKFKAYIRKAFHRQKPLSLAGKDNKFAQRSLSFHLSSAYFLKEERTQYQYKLEGLDYEWSEWKTQTTLDFPVLPSGKYTISVKARNVFGQESEIDKLSFTIEKEIWEYPVFYMFVLVVFVLISYLLMKVRVRSLATAKNKLEQKVQEKTNEIQRKQQSLKEALEEISTQKEEIQQKNYALQHINQQLEQKVEERTTKLKSTLLQLLQTNKELDTFIYRASHDLRGPISRLIGLVHLIRIDPQQEAILKHIDFVEFTAQKMDNMLDKLMNIHAIHSEQLDLEHIDLAQFIQSIKKKFQSQMGHQNVFLMTKLPDEKSLISDQTLLSIIVSNLIENTIQFANPKSEVFSIAKLEIKVNEEFIHIKVIDNGLGVHPEIQDRIFDMFFRGHTNSQGNGLGLYLVKKATEKLNGQIHFKSEPEKLTSFSIILPNPAKTQNNQTQRIQIEAKPNN